MKIFTTMDNPARRGRVLINMRLTEILLLFISAAKHVVAFPEISTSKY